MLLHRDGAMGAVDFVRGYDWLGLMIPLRGLIRHLFLTLRLNFASPQAVAYGYLLPILFLIAFGSLFHASQPPLLGQMGMLLTITALGGACFGMPTAMVAERQQGVWRRYRLLPAAAASLVLSTMVARFVLIASAGVMQVLLARAMYGTTLPGHWLQLAGAFGVVAFAFEGIGLIIAMLADAVPAVQAIGQSVFLPMIIIGGVGVPLGALPAWAQKVAGFLPGRYAVEALQACINGGGLGAVRFSIVALLVIGVCACAAGAAMFRWDAQQKLTWRSRAWVLVALLSWAAVGIAADRMGKLSPVLAEATGPWEAMTAGQADGVTYDNLSDDQSTVTPIISSPQDIAPDDQRWMERFRPRLAAWSGANDPDLVQRTRNLLSAAAVADLAEDPHEGEMSYLVFELLRKQVPHDELVKVVTYIIYHPEDGRVLTSVSELDLGQAVRESDVRDRSAQYARKLLGRLLGKL